MGFINLENRTNDGNNLFPQGTYEMKILNVTGDASPSGHENMRFEFLVRTDLDKVPELKRTNAVAHNRHFFTSVWTAKDKESGKDTGKYKDSDLANIANAIGLSQEQINKYIKGKDDLMRACKGKYIRIYISLSENEYQGKTTKQNSTFTNTWQKTKYPIKKQAKPEDPFKDNEGADISDDDIPF